MTQQLPVENPPNKLPEPLANSSKDEPKTQQTIQSLFGKKRSKEDTEKKAKERIGRDNKFKPQALFFLLLIPLVPVAYIKFTEWSLNSQPTFSQMTTKTASAKQTSQALLPKTPTYTPTRAATIAPTHTPTETFIPSLTPTETYTPTETLTPTPTLTLTSTWTSTPTGLIYIGLLPVRLTKDGRTNSGVFWKDVSGFGAACPYNLPLGSRVTFQERGDSYLCVDRSNFIHCDTAICQIQIFIDGQAPIEQKPRLAFITMPDGASIVIGDRPLPSATLLGQKKTPQ